jgi:antirestriction protein
MVNTTSPIRIYVASLADYNGGTLHGKWIDANQDTDAIMEEVKAMLAGSREEVAEEWAIHDYEGFEGLRLGEWESFEKVAESAAAIAEHGEAYALYADCVGMEYADVDGFEDAYQGKYDSMAEFAEELYDSIGDNLGPLAGYIDWERVGRDFELGGDYFCINGHVFNNN